MNHRILSPRFFCGLLAMIFLSLLSAECLNAQCVTITNLPDTINMCKNTSVQFNPSITSSGFLQTLDTTWTPAAGLSGTHVLNPVATVGTTSISYKLTVTALTPSNFVANGDFSGGYTGFTSSYIIGTGGTYGQLSNEGTYAVTSNANNVHTNFTSFFDHTLGTSAGSMMCINGASSPISIWCETITVVPNTNYDFSAWGASCTASNPAILQFSINGTLLGTPLSLPTTTGLWTRFHALWNSGANTSITICIYDQQTAASGNDFAIDDIAFRQVCYATDSVYLRVANMQPGIADTVKLGCAADTVKLGALNNGGTTPTQYIWDFGDGTGSQLKNVRHVYTTQGQYTIRLKTKQYGCADSTSVMIDTRHPLSIGFTGDNDTVCQGTPIRFTNSDAVTGTPVYYWNFGDGQTDNTANPSHNYALPGIYTVTHVITDAIPCSDTLQKVFVVQPSTNAQVAISDSSVCPGTTIHFTSGATPGYDTLMWQFGDGTVLYNTYSTNHAYDTSGTFTATFTVAYPRCPTIILNKTIKVWSLPAVNIGPDTSLCPNAVPATLANLVPGAADDRNLWSDSSHGSSIAVSKPGTYWLQVTNAKGCLATDSLTVLNACYLDIPNAFTPNGDGENDYFFPRQFLGSELTFFHMQIFDRWGEQIFETTTLNGRGWDGRFNGKTQPAGVYIYLIEASIQGGSLQKYRGNVTLLR